MAFQQQRNDDDMVVVGEKSRGDVLDLLLSRASIEAPYFTEEPVHYEGQLAVDMIETATDLVIVSTIAGAELKSLSININGDVITIRGRRDTPVDARAHEYLYKECYWGWFSRTIVLPLEVDAENTGASFHHGVLTITLPKQVKVKEVPIHIIEE
jgi:HSP20 family protein